MNRRRRLLKRKIRKSTLRINQISTLLIIVFVLAISFFTLYTDKSDVNAQCSWVEPSEIRVRSGDTLWGIAQSIPGSENIDIRQAVFEIKQLNNLTSSSLTPGQVLIVPVSFQ